MKQFIQVNITRGYLLILWWYSNCKSNSFMASIRWNLSKSNTMERAKYLFSNIRLVTTNRIQKEPTCGLSYKHWMIEHGEENSKWVYLEFTFKSPSHFQTSCTSHCTKLFLNPDHHLAFAKWGLTPSFGLKLLNHLAFVAWIVKTSLRYPIRQDPLNV